MDVGVSTSVLVSHVDSVSRVQLSWYLGSIIASARLPPQPIEKPPPKKPHPRREQLTRPQPGNGSPSSHCDIFKRIVVTQSPSVLVSPSSGVWRRSPPRLSAADQHQHTGDVCVIRREGEGASRCTHSERWLAQRGADSSSCCIITAVTQMTSLPITVKHSFVLSRKIRIPRNYTTTSLPISETWLIV